MSKCFGQTQSIKTWWASASVRCWKYWKMVQFFQSQHKEGISHDEFILMEASTFASQPTMSHLSTKHCFNHLRQLGGRQQCIFIFLPKMNLFLKD